MLLTSLKRMKFTLNLTNDESDPKLTQLIATVSKRIEHYCKRNFKKTSYTEEFNPIAGQTVFRPKSYPIESISSISTDWTGQYSGNEIALTSDSYRISHDSRTIICNTIPRSSSQSFSDWSVVYPSSLRTVYVGGLGEHAVNEQWTVSGGSGSITVANYTSAVGSDSAAVGYIKSYTSAAAQTLVCENLFGEFEVGETITIGSATRVLVSKNNTILANDYIDLVTACELQVRFLWKHYDDLENGSVQKDGQSSVAGPAVKSLDYTFLPEVRDLLERFRNKVLESPTYT